MISKEVKKVIHLVTCAIIACENHQHDNFKLLVQGAMPTQPHDQQINYTIKNIIKTDYLFFYG